VVPPEISDKHSTADMNINEGSPAKFVCSATGIGCLIIYLVVLYKIIVSIAQKQRE
jgi:hypothetical protein